MKKLSLDLETVEETDIRNGNWNECKLRFINEQF